MRTRISTDKEGEKWLPWAKRKLAQLRALRLDLNLPKMTKTFDPAPGARVWLSASEFGDWIRVTAAQAPWILVGFAGSGTVRRGYAQPPDFLKPTFPLRDSVPPDNTTAPPLLASLDKTRTTGYRSENVSGPSPATYVVNSHGEVLVPLPADGRDHATNRSPLALRPDMLAYLYGVLPLGPLPANALVDQRRLYKIGRAKWDGTSWATDLLSIDMPEVRAAINALPPTTAALMNDPATATYPVSEVMENYVHMTVPGTFTVSNAALATQTRNNLLILGNPGTIEFGGRYAPIFNELGYLENSLTLVEEGYTTTGADGIIDPTGALGGGPKYLNARYQLWTGTLTTKRFTHVMDMLEGTSALKRSETASATIYVWTVATNTDPNNVSGLYGTAQVAYGWLESGSTIAPFPALATDPFSSWTSISYGMPDSTGHCLEAAPLATVATVTAAAPGAVPGTLFTAPGASFSPTRRATTTVDITFRAYRDSTLMWSRVFAGKAPGTGGLNADLAISTDQFWVDSYRLAVNYTEPRTVGAITAGSALETGVGTGVFVDTFPTNPVTARVVGNSKTGKFYATRDFDNVANTYTARVYDAADNLLYTGPDTKYALFDYDTETVVWIFDLGVFTLLKVTLSQDPTTHAWTATEGALYTPPADIELDGAPLPAAFVEILPPGLIPSGTPT